MNDCYQILGVSRHASTGEIRAAYLARMKVCHPDAGRAGPGDEAARISQAYWQLRDAHRRAEHDRLLFDPPLAAPPPLRTPRKVSLAKRPGKPRRAARPAAPLGAKSARQRPKGKRLDPLRAAAGVAACSLAIIGFALAGTQFGAPAAPQARAAPPAAAKAATAPVSRRPIDEALAEAAADEFRLVVARSGLSGAHLYARQCLMELTARPTMTMLDYCIAFDDEASAWEKTPRASRTASGRSYFAADQRFGRYASAAQALAPGPVRESMMADVSFFAREDD